MQCHFYVYVCNTTYTKMNALTNESINFERMFYQGTNVFKQADELTFQLFSQHFFSRSLVRSHISQGPTCTFICNRDHYTVSIFK